MKILCLLPFALCIGVSAQSSFPPEEQTSSITGIAAGQTARVSVLYPSSPAPILQVQCTVTLAIADDQGSILKSQDFQISGGKAVSISLNADTDLSGSQGKALIHGSTLTPAASTPGGKCPLLIPSLDIVDNDTGKTTAHLEMRVAWPPSAAYTRVK